MSNASTHSHDHAINNADEATIHDDRYDSHEKKEGGKESIDVSEDSEVVDSPYDDTPDGGLRAWLVVLGVSFCLFVCVGSIINLALLGCLWNFLHLWICQCLGSTSDSRPFS